MADIHELASETDKRLSVHEAICAQRYESIQGRFDDGSKRMTKIEYLLYGVIVCVLFGPGVAGELVKKVLGLYWLMSPKQLEPLPLVLPH
jgi:hypothetical protein